MRFIVPNPFRRGWSIRLGRLRLFSVPWYWDRVRERLTGRAVGRTTALRRRTHQHYCEGCDGNWAHEGQMCAQQWAWQCPACRPPKIGPAGPEAAPRVSIASGDSRSVSPADAGTVRQRLGRWFMVVRRDRAELCQQLGESFGGDSRIIVVLDRRHSERRGRPEPKASLAVERRRWTDRRTPPTDQDSYTWASLGFRPHRDRSLGPR